MVLETTALPVKLLPNVEVVKKQLARRLTDSAETVRKLNTGCLLDIPRLTSYPSDHDGTRTRKLPA